eukprot:243385_1
MSNATMKLNFILKLRYSSYVTPRSIQFTTIKHAYIVHIQARSYLIKEDEDHQKSFIPRSTGGNKMSYSDIYMNKKRKKASRSFWRSYKRAFSATILGTAGFVALIFLGHNFYEKDKQVAG